MKVLQFMTFLQITDNSTGCVFVHCYDGVPSISPRSQYLTLIRVAGGVYDFRNFEQV